MGLSTFDAFKRMTAEGAVPVEGESLRALQACLLTILDDIISVCSEEGIGWTLGGGSALGALRHQGFIPWDDDLDVNLPRAEWPRFRAAFARRFGEKYAIYEPGSPEDYPLAFPRLRLRGTRYVTREDLMLNDVEPGVFVDVFLLENTYDDRFRRTLHGLGSLALGFLYSCRKQFGERRLQRRWGLNGFVFRIKRLIGLCFSWRSLGAWTRTWDRWNARCRNDKSCFVTFPVGRRHFFGELASRASMGGCREEAFEGRHVKCAVDLEAYMTRLYGPEYLTPPSPAVRERHVIFAPLVLPGKTKA